MVDVHWTLMRALFASVILLLDSEVIETSLITYILTCKVKKWNDDILKFKLDADADDGDEVTIDIDSVLDDKTHLLVAILEAWDLTVRISGLQVNIVYLISENF